MKVMLMGWSREQCCAVISLLVAAPAHATFYPYYSSAAHQRAQETPVEYRPAQPLPPSVVPPRYYAPYGAATASTAAPQVIAPLPASAPAVIEPPPLAASTQKFAPVENTAIAAPPLYTPPAAAYTAPVFTDTVSRHGNNRFYFGAEIYYDQYKEPDVDLNNQGVFGSLTYGFTHYFNPSWFAAFEGRSTYGRTGYSSISGKISQIVEFEFDHRLNGGYDFDLGAGRHLKPYAGIGLRYFDDELKGEVTNSSPPALGYDRRILQIYAPIGASYEFPAFGLTFEPRFEVDPLLAGFVESRFQNIGLKQATNKQFDGYGLRGELMMGKVDANGFGWQFGPFVRYWDINDSETADCNDVTAGVGFCIVEPKNTRLQAGATARFLF